MSIKKSTPPAVPSTGPAQGKEEPEIAQEDDIPSDDGGRPASDDKATPEQRPLRDVERE